VSAEQKKKRTADQPFSIDRLPQETRDEILRLKNDEGRTFEEIEEMSATFVKWDALPTPTLELFPNLRVPKSNIQRWYQKRWKQAIKETLVESRATEKVVQKFAALGIDGTNDAVMNAMRDQVFAIMRKAGKQDRKDLIAGFTELSLALARLQRVALQKQRLGIDEKRLQQLQADLDMKQRKFDKATNEAADKLGKGKELTLDDINRLRQRTFGLPPVQRSAPASNPA
jgi:hypothetical protein